MTTTIARKYHFESAHFLPNVPDGHRCKQLHGHNYIAEIEVAGRLNHVGFVIDFWDLDAVMAPLIKQVDHTVLNKVAGLENPTAEIIAHWFVERITFALDKQLRLVRVCIFETHDARATVELWNK